jgi:hypothetical protein
VKVACISVSYFFLNFLSYEFYIHFYCVLCPLNSVTFPNNLLDIPVMRTEFGFPVEAIDKCDAVSSRRPTALTCRSLWKGKQLVPRTRSREQAYVVSSGSRLCLSVCI